MEAFVKATEEALREATAAKGVPLSIVRGGTLKGGGPGNGGVGLDSAYYNTIGDLSQYMTAQGYDK